MDKKQAQAIIKETFESPFNKDKFISFTKNLLNQIKDETFAFYGQFIPDAYKPYINRYERIGVYPKRDDDNRVDILIVHLNKETSIERARTMQRNFIAGYLAGKYGSSAEKNAALVAFVAPDEEDWRFSLVKMDYRFDEGKKGQLKAKEYFSPARRWSFLVGVHENSHTAQSQLVDILADDEHNPTLAQLEESFNIEKVTKEFFEKYRELFLWTKETLDDVVKKENKIKKDFDTKRVNIVDFSKKLLGQIVFLYFLQKKGWFGVKRDADWGTGPKNFLQELFERKHGTYKNFFNDILEPLFYEALARERDDDFYSRFNCKIPFLNGGLFDPINNYDWVHTDILLPNNLFSNDNNTKEGDKGNGILDIFNRYNFTVKEDEPLEKEVAIDPEMLGKAYEKFNAIRPDNYEEYKKALKSGQKGAESKFNKQYGVYYTPREVVYYMCKQSLINYLTTEIFSPSPLMGEGQGEGVIAKPTWVKQSQIPTKEDIETLVKYGEQVGENEAIVEAKGKETKDYKYKLPESIRQIAKLIDEKLANIKVCDPAVGSGAFPVGMMSEIVKTRNVLTNYLSNTPSPLMGEGKDDGVIANEVKQSRTLYNFKRECIEKSLYGVDIDFGAVEIAKLRLWLSLVVDEDDIKQIKPLPNLDYKIMQGNSLLEEFEGIELFNEKFIYGFDSIEEQRKLLIKKQNEKHQEFIKLQHAGQLSKIKMTEFEGEFKNISESLKSLDRNKEGKNHSTPELFDEFNKIIKKVEELKKLHKEFFETSQKNKKDELRKEIDNLEWELIEITLKEQGKEDALKKLLPYKISNTKPYFLWKLNFPEVFQQGGFNIVIANPPYVPIANLTKEINDVLSKQNYKTFSKSADIYCLFYEKGMNLSHTNGILSYISSNRFCFTNYGVGLRKYLCQKNILELVNFNEINVFENANVGSIVTFIQNNKPSDKKIFINEVKDELNLDIIASGGKKVERSFYQESQWIFAETVSQSLKQKIESKGMPFNKWKGITINRGITTGANNIFIIDEFKRKDLIKEDSKSKEILVPVLRGSNIKRYSISKPNQYLIFTFTNIKIRNYPAIYKYLTNHRTELEEVYEAKHRQKKWYELRKCSYYDKFLMKKLVWTRLSNENAFSISVNGEFTVDSSSFAVGDNIEYLSAVLNSKVVLFYFKLGSVIWGKDGIKWFGKYFDNIPIPDAPPEKQKPIIELVNKILSITKDDDYLQNSAKRSKVKELEHQIDQLVYKLYGLTEEEIKIVEK